MDTMQALLLGRFRSQYEWPVSGLNLFPCNGRATGNVPRQPLCTQEGVVTAPILVHTSSSLVSIPILDSFSRNAAVDSLLVLLQKPERHGRGSEPLYRMGGFGDRLGVDVNCARQIYKQRFDHRWTPHVGWRCYCGVCFGVGVVGWLRSAPNRQAAACASSLLLRGVDCCFVLTK